MATRAKVLEFEAAVDEHGGLSAEGCPPLELPDEWTAEHLLLAALMRCSLTSFHHHARKIGARSSGRARIDGTVTRRERDGRYAFVEIAIEVEVELDPSPQGRDLEELLVNAERDCFIAASLSLTPRYEWRVNGVTARAAPS